MYLCTRFWFRSSVGLEQQPSKLWVLGSNPNGITKVQNNVKEDSTSVASSLLLIYSLLRASNLKIITTHQANYQQIEVYAFRQWLP